MRSSKSSARGRLASVAFLSSVALGCAENPIRPVPNLPLEPGKELPLLQEFEASLDLTDGIDMGALRRPPLDELVDAQIEAMTKYTQARAGRVLRGRVPGTRTDSAKAGARAGRERLAQAALELLPHLKLDTAEAELGHVAASAVAQKLGKDAEYRLVAPPTETAAVFSQELREGVAVLRLGQLTDGNAEKVIASLNQWSTLANPPRATLLDLSECELGEASGASALVNTFAPGQLAFALEFRDMETRLIERGQWRGKPGWGTPALAQVPLFIWVSARSGAMAEAAATALRLHRGARLLGGMSRGSGRLMFWQRLPWKAWFGFTTADVIGADGTPLRGQPLIPDACPVGAELVRLSERTPEAFHGLCGTGEPQVHLDAVLHYLRTVLSSETVPAGPGSLRPLERGEEET